MSKTLNSARHKALVGMLAELRKDAGLTQAQVARRLGQYQSFVARVESGQRRIDLVEFLSFAEAIGFDPKVVIRRLAAVRGRG